MISLADIPSRLPAPVAGPERVARADSSTENGAGVLSTVPVVQVQIDPGSRIALAADPGGAGADRFRFLRMKLREQKAAGHLCSLTITSAFPEDGKSTIAMNLATALAERGKRNVLLIEGDLHHPTLAVGLGIDPQPGLAECLQSDLDPLSVLQRLDPLGWCLLHAGAVQGNASEALQTDGLHDLLRRLSAHFDWILIDTPPVMPLTDALSLSKHADGVLLVVRSERTPRAAVDEALARLGNRPILGIVLNCAEGLDRLYSKYYRHYAGRLSG